MGAIVALMGGGLKYVQRYIKQPGGAPGGEGVQFSSDESDLMLTVFKSALRMITGSASRNELASELSDKLYQGRMDEGTMSELGIELVKPGADSPAPEGGAGTANSQPGATSPAKRRAGAGESRPDRPSGGGRAGRTGEPRAGADLIPSGGRAVLAQFWERAKDYTVELAVVPVALLAMVVVRRIRRRAGEGAFVPPSIAIENPADSDTDHMTHAVHSLNAEEFEMLVALIYRRQGYRVSLPAGLGGGRGVDFTLVRKSERVLVQCRKLRLEHKVPVERVCELREAVTAAGATRGMYVASCGFTWDARNFAKANRVTLINGRTLDELIAAARESPDEDLLEVSQWAQTFMSKVELTTPHCPACEAKMEQINVSDGSVWVCSQRPECRGRRSARKHHNPPPRQTASTLYS